MQGRIKIPRRFSIGGRTFSVEFSDSLEKEGNIGQCNHRTGVITLSSKVRRSAREEIYVHEIIEAVNGVFELGLHHGVITALGIAIHHALVSGEGTLEKPPT